MESIFNFWEVLFFGIFIFKSRIEGYLQIFNFVLTMISWHRILLTFPIGEGGGAEGQGVTHIIVKPRLVGYPTKRNFILITIEREK